MQRDQQAMCIAADMALARAASTRAAKIIAMRSPASAGGAVLRPDDGAVDHRQEFSVAVAVGQGLKRDVPRSEAVQRRNWRNTEFQLPSSAGRSRHGAPVRAVQKMASSTRWWLRAGLPPSGLADAKKGSKKDHSSSVSRPRINADFHARDQPGSTPASGREAPLRRLVHAT